MDPNPMEPTVDPPLVLHMNLTCSLLSLACRQVHTPRGVLYRCWYTSCGPSRARSFIMYLYLQVGVPAEYLPPISRHPDSQLLILFKPINRALLKNLPNSARRTIPLEHTPHFKVTAIGVIFSLLEWQPCTGDSLVPLIPAPVSHVRIVVGTQVAPLR